LDAAQSDISSIPNIENSQYNTIAIQDVSDSCNQMGNFASKSESSFSSQDELFDYQLGLWDFEILCGIPGSTVDIQIYLDTVYDTSEWFYRKFDEQTSTYTNISSIVDYRTETVGTNPVTVISYSITDGGLYDEDGVANGVIIDPS
jgi:hypothetical protein